jgi:hypothetical protein
MQLVSKPRHVSYGFVVVSLDPKKKKKKQKKVIVKKLIIFVVAFFKRPSGASLPLLKTNNYGLSRELDLIARENITIK